MADALIKERGPFELFGLFLREGDEDQGNWDLVVAAPWLDTNLGQGLRDISTFLFRYLDEDQRSVISRIAHVKHGDPFLLSLQGALHVTRSSGKVQDCIFGGVPIRAGYLFEVTRQHVPKLRRSRDRTRRV
jgi:hypothetical protein